MELEELKNTWMVLDEQLKKNEMLNKQIIREMLYKKSNKSLNGLINTEFFGMIVALLALPLCIGLYNYRYHILVNTLSAKILMVVCIATCILGIVWMCYKIWKYLLKIDFSKSVKDNIQWVNQYAIVIKKEKIVSYFIVLPVFSLLGIYNYYERKVNFSFWIFLVVVLIVIAAITYWSYKKIYDANIQSIKKSLEELNELN